MLIRLILAATLADGILASGNVNRALVDMPAWSHVGPVAWAEFSRYADLGRSAMLLYPLEAFAGTILSVAAAVVFFRSEHPRSGSLPIYAAAAFTVAGLLLTIKAAPAMLSVRYLPADPQVLQQAFARFEFWGGLRGVAQVLGYLANLASLIVVAKLRTSQEDKNPSR